MPRKSTASSSVAAAAAVVTGESSDSDWEVEEEQIVHVEIAGIFQDDLRRNPHLITKFVGLDTESPVVQLGNQVFVGKYTDVVGTPVFFRTAAAESGSSNGDAVFDVNAAARKLEYLCKTDKKLVLKRVFLHEKDCPEVQQHDDSSSSNSRRPMNAFLLFCKRHRAIVKEKYPNLENRNITKILGEWWQSLSDEEKANFNVLASEYKEHVMREQPNFRWRKPPPMSVASTHYTKSQTVSVQSVHHESNGGVRFGDALPLRQQAQQPASSNPRPDVACLFGGAAKEVIRGNRGDGGHSSASSNSSSPEPSLIQGMSDGVSSTAAPKPFKKRYLAAEKARLFNPSEVQHPVSPDAEHACKALLQLAGVRESSPTEGVDSSNSSSSNGGSRSGTSSPPSRDGQSGDPLLPPTALQQGQKPQDFSSLRDAVWGRVARTLLKQEEEKGSRGQTTTDAPLNLSSQCTLRSQTIIEHIIENILDMPLVEGDQEHTTAAMNLNNNSSAINGVVENGICEETAEEIKERIYQGLKQDILKRVPGAKDDKDRSALWKVLPQSNITNHPKNSKAKEVAAVVVTKAPTPPTPAISAPRCSSVIRKEIPAAAAVTLEVEGGDVDDASKLNIKNLLAQSPAPLSPRSKSTCPSTASLTNAVIASVLQQQQPVELFLGQRRPVLPTTSSVAAVSVTLVTTSSEAKPLNLSTSPPLTPSVSLSLTPACVDATANATVSPNKRKLSPSEDDDEDIRRSSRSCKGRRYQEFKDEVRLGKKGVRRGHRSGDSADSSTEDAVQLTRLAPSATTAAVSDDQTASRLATAATSVTSAVTGEPPTVSNTHNAATFDVVSKLNAIPALSLEAYQQRILRAKAGGPVAGNNASPVITTLSTSSQASAASANAKGGAPDAQSRLRSGELQPLDSTNQVSSSKRKTRRNGGSGGGPSSVSPGKNGGGEKSPADFMMVTS